MYRYVLFFFFVITTSIVNAGENLVDNGSFEADAESDGLPDKWQTAGDGLHIEQQLSFSSGRDGKRCAMLRCSQVKTRNPTCSAMLCQFDVPVEKGKTYRMTFWAKCVDITADVVSVAIVNFHTGENCGLDGMFAPNSQWQQYEFVFYAMADCPKGSRLQIWFESTGILWLDDMIMVEADRDLFHPTNVIPSGESANLILNAGFECGTDGWGSADWDYLQKLFSGVFKKTGSWQPAMNCLYGELDSNTVFEGHNSLRIEMSPGKAPIACCDYYEPFYESVKSPLAANIGFLEVKPRKPYVLSVWMKADTPNTPARMAVKQFEGELLDRPLRVGTTWQLFEFPFTPDKRWCYVLAGPDLSRQRKQTLSPNRSVVWLDAMQLEQAASASKYSQRVPLELGMSTDKLGNIFSWDEPLQFHLLLACDNLNIKTKAVLALRLTDFFDKEVWNHSVKIDIPSNGVVKKTFIPEKSDRLRGFMQLHVTVTAGDKIIKQSLRLASIPVHHSNDSRFGVNHAYPWPHLLDLAQKAGLTWIRDWSLKWQSVEPKKGQIDFTQTDHQIKRIVDHKMKILGLLPFPSSNWSSSAPADIQVPDVFPDCLKRVAHAPKNKTEFENYITCTIDYYKKKINWWQVFNEPVWMDHYALPRSCGYTAKDYARWTKVFAEAARKADPNCRIIAGIGYLSDDHITRDYNLFFSDGGLDICDVIDIHHYPHIRPPEHAESILDELNALMEKSGGRKPIWLTECGYYANDQPVVLPRRNGFLKSLASEQMQAVYVVRYAAIMFSRGVEKIFYHAGRCEGINDEALSSMFFQYDGNPRRVYAAQAVMANMIKSDSRYSGCLEIGEGVHAYMFYNQNKTVAIIWAPKGVKAKPVCLINTKLQLIDIMGRPLHVKEFTPRDTPVYVVGQNITMESFYNGFSDSRNHSR